MESHRLETNFFLHVIRHFYNYFKLRNVVVSYPYLNALFYYYICYYMIFV